MVLVLLGITILLFFALRLSGDPVAMLVPHDATLELMDQVRERLGLAEPMHVQFGRFLLDVLQLDFGRSLVDNRPAIQIVLGRLPNTMLLAFAAVVFSVAVAVPLGVLSAIGRHRVGSYLILLCLFVGQAMPAFWLGLLLILVFAVWLGWFPSFGYGTAAHLVLPVLTASTFMLVRMASVVRGEMLSVMSQDYVRTARAKGLRTSAVLFKHAMRNCLIPVLTVIGLDLGAMIGGSVVTETIFAWPGLGRELVNAVLQRDYPVVQATVFVTAAGVVLINLVVELLYAAVDPRVRLA